MRATENNNNPPEIVAPTELEFQITDTKLCKVNDSIKQYDEIRKISAGQGDDYTTGCLLDFAYFEKNYRLIAADLSKQKALDADPKAIHQIIFNRKANDNITVFYIYEKSKETKSKVLEFAKGTTKVY